MRYDFLVAFVLVVVLAAVAWLGYIFNDQIEDQLGRYNGMTTAVSALVGFYSFAASVLYHRNPRFHFWVRRLLFRMSRTHTYWKPLFRFQFDELTVKQKNEVVSKAADAIKRAFKGDAVLDDSSVVSSAILIDDEVRVVLRFDGDALAVCLDRKQLVPSHLYERACRRLVKIAESVREAVPQPTSTAYAVTVTFDVGASNPYYGFFLNHIPEALVDDFEVRFKLNKDSSCRIEAVREFVNIESASLVDWREALSKVVTLEAAPVGGS
ncbi:MAG: hypothetical protein ACRC1K_09010 [Planctomycetia bacterium]